LEKLLAFIGKNRIIKIPGWLILLLPFISYLGWEYYWYKQFDLAFIKWHTHLAAYVYLWLIGFVCYGIFFRNSVSEKAKNRFLLFSAVLFSFFVLEISLLLTGFTKTYFEEVSGYYRSQYLPVDKGHYHLWKPNAPHFLSKPEYRFWRPTNSEGLGDGEWVIAKKLNEKRILALGDSFTEGDGAPNDSSYVSLLKQKCLAAGDTFTFMNAGVCGSDPFINFVLLRDRLLSYQPDIVIQGLGTNDMNTDINIRGGMERFQKDGTLKYNSAPWWEPVYAVSYVSRIFFNVAGYNELLRKKNMPKEEEKKLNAQTEDLFQRYATLCKQNNIHLIIVLRPDKLETENNKYEYDFSEIIHQLKADTTVQVIDLLPFYRKHLAQTQTKIADYYWQHDGHHNAKGYDMMATGIYRNLNSLHKNNTPYLEK
jgi:lysophospholipase L1-like esterase